MDEDFAFRQDLAKELRRQDIDVVEFSNSARFLDMIDDQNPDIVLIHVNTAAPHECVRALLALRECRYSGAVQLFGQCEPRMLESFKTIGLDNSLAMLSPLQKPIKVTTLHRIIRDRGLGAVPSQSASVSLKEALAKQLLTFFYQPKLCLQTSEIVGAEVVARIAHPEVGIITPEQFLKGADEETLLQLTRLALVHAIKTSARFHEQGEALQLSVNISADMLSRLPISDLVLMHRPERPDWAGLLLEIPERQVVNKIELLKSRVPKLLQSGVSLAIDNFGRGSFCVNILNQMQFSEVKIDRSIVDGCAANPANVKICRALIQMAHSFGCRTVAVGVSTPTDLQTLRQLDCDMAQGFLLGKPMTAQQMDSLVASSKGRPQILST
jgi:EAL domain-containing protein (putative c-di-GMP-specific phosphodiesterase class I)